VDLGDPFVFRFSRLDSLESASRSAAFQLLEDGSKAIGRFRMPGPHVVLEIGGMKDEARRTHAWNRSTQESA
jgi:hypothetical protein